MKLSVVFFARNDGYNGNYLQRLEHSIKSLQISLSGHSWELVLVDYNPPKDTKNLSEIFNCDNINHIVVSPNKHKTFVKNHLRNKAILKTPDGKLPKKRVCKFPFIAPYAFNEGVRESSGEYILTTSTDNIFPKNFGDLVGRLKPNIVYRALLKSLPQASAIAEFSNIVNGNNFKTPHGMKKRNKVKLRSFNKACGDFMLVDRNSWLEVGGLVPICHVRGRALDSQVLFYFMSLGKEVYCPKFFIVNIHRRPVVERLYQMNNINYIVNSNGIHYNHDEELSSPEYKKFSEYSGNRAPYNNKTYKKTFGFNINRIEEIKSLFSHIQGYKTVE